MKRIAAGLLFGAASALTLAASPPILPDCQAHQIRYSLLVRDADVAALPQPEAWHRVKLTAAQAEDLPLFGEAEMRMGEWLADQRAPAPTLVSRCWAPAQGGDISAYVATVEQVVAAARSTRALAVGDGETGEWQTLAYFSAALTKGQTAPHGAARVSRTNPPAMEIMESPFTVDATDDGGLRTRGFRKLGLPDLSLSPELPGDSFIVFMQALGNLALSGRVPLAPDVPWNLPLKAIVAHHAVRPTKETSLQLRWRAVSGPPAALLRLELAEAGERHPFEQQMLMAEALWGSRYAALGPERARELGLAVARAKSRLVALRARFPSLVAEGGRLWVQINLERMAKQLASRPGAWTEHWFEVVAWDRHGALTLRLWQGDPRSGGMLVRMPHTATIGPNQHEHVHSILSADLAEDWLLQEGAGRFTAGEPLALLAKWYRPRAEAPSPP